MAKKRQPVHTAAGAAKVMQSVLAGDIQPPEHVKLRTADLPFWRSIIESRPANAWDTADLEMAANLARTKSDCERLAKEIEVTGDIVINQKGTPIVNPQHTLLETLTRRAVALTRLLHCHPEAKEGPSEKQPARNTASRNAKARVDELSDEALLPGIH